VRAVRVRVRYVQMSYWPYFGRFNSATTASILACNPASPHGEPVNERSLTLPPRRSGASEGNAWRCDELSEGVVG
jgi:hypothetical protein